MGEPGRQTIAVHFSAEAYDVLKDAAARRNKTISEFLRDAIAFETWCLDVMESGGSILVERDGHVRELRWLP